MKKIYSAIKKFSLLVGAVYFLFTLDFIKHATAQNVLYSLDLANPATYTTTCGVVNAGQWMVEQARCNLTTPYVKVPGDSLVNGPVDIPFEFRLSAGNVLAIDSAVVRMEVNGNWSDVRVFIGVNGFGTSYYFWNKTVPSGSMLRLQVYFAANTVDPPKNGLWKLKSGELRIGAPGEVLPVELIDFSGRYEKNAVNLNWTTLSELNNDEFVIERSENGSEFVSIGTVKGAGNSSNTLNYVFYDENPMYGVSYYRLKQIDFDGVVNYPGYIISITVKDEKDFEIYPNPNTGRRLFVDLSDINEEDSILYITDSNGNKVLLREISLQPGINKTILRNLRFTAGIYFVSVVTNDDVITKKLIVY